MANFLQGDVIFGQNALTNTTSFINQIDSVSIQNGVFGGINIVNRYDPTLNADQPTSWENDFIMNATFEDGTSAGSVANLLGVANKILVMKRESGLYSNINDGWITVAEMTIEDRDDLKFVVHDYMCRCGATYEYVLIPTLLQVQGGVEIQVETSITSDSTILSVLSEFDRIYICTQNKAESLYAGVTFDNMTTERLTGVHKTLGNKYPIVVTNGRIKYHTGGVSGIILNKYYGRIDPNTNDIAPLDREKIIKARKEFDDFITQGIPMVLKDWNGNIWLIMNSDSPTYNWDNSWGMGLGSVSFSWTEIGDINSQEDIDKAGMIYRSYGGDISNEE